MTCAQLSAVVAGVSIPLAQVKGLELHGTVAVAEAPPPREDAHYDVIVTSSSGRQHVLKRKATVFKLYHALAMKSSGTTTMINECVLGHHV